ncbi:MULTISPECIES: alpha/beta hydrolase fold domain-containing protein [Brachybacterium]|uniref:alpha/beta hydrolase fold domain-containing protein n=1 Tax=Brachybacterium TaxID=43668 RepID=UPI0012667817|nr:alpha/beta hydrolase fold domain-containing protein [Brachybacterium subflavum]
MSASLQEAYEAALAAKPAHVQAMSDAQHPGRVKGPAPLPPDVPERYEVEEREIAGFPVQVLHPHESSSGIQVVYFHGGAYTLPFQESHGRIVLGLADRTGADLWIPHYLPGPDGTIEDALPFVDALAREVPSVAGDNRYIVAGESAGGNMALVQTLRAAQSGTRMPDHLVVHAPWVDLRTADPESVRMEPTDVLMTVDNLHLSARNWAGGRDLTDPMVSPIFGHIGSLPPVTVLQGTRDLLLPDVLRFVQEARAQGVEVELDLVEGAFHVYPAADAPEAHAALDLAARRILG